MPDRLSDALRKLAEDDAPPGNQQQPSQAPPQTEHQVDDALVSALHESTSAADQTQSHEPTRPTMRRQHSLKLALLPLLATVGVLLIGLAVWATFVLAGYHVWRSDHPGAHQMAAAMLVCYPIGLTLIAAAVHMGMKVARNRGA